MALATKTASRFTCYFEELHEVIVLTVDVTTYCDRGPDIHHVGFSNKDFTSLLT
jgi:hypothetical protein